MLNPLTTVCLVVSDQCFMDWTNIKWGGGWCQLGHAPPPDSNEGGKW